MTNILHTRSMKPSKKSCCVCLKNIRFPKLTTIYTCNVCVDTHVCNKCFDVMRDSNMHHKCPVCRSEKWCAFFDNVLIITDVDPLTEENPDTSSTSVSINITINNGRNENTIPCEQHIGYLRITSLLFLKFCAFIMISWSLGFIILSIVHGHFYLYDWRDVIFMSIFVGFLAFCLLLYLRVTIILSTPL
jgi:RNA polymerase subunit RPABC4/transcription elongation factor Spt4